MPLSCPFKVGGVIYPASSADADEKDPLKQIIAVNLALFLLSLDQNLMNLSPYLGCGSQNAARRHQARRGEDRMCFLATQP